MDPNSIIAAVSDALSERLFTAAQLQHMMDMLECEIVNRMAQENGHDSLCEVDP